MIAHATLPIESSSRWSTMVSLWLRTDTASKGIGFGGKP